MGMDRLSPDEVERYRDTGIVIPRYRLPIGLLRGVDRTGRNDFSIGHRPELATA